MKLTYRGVRYCPTPASPATVETGEQGVFLGAPFKFKAQTVCPIKGPSKFLKYRGVLYIR